VTAGGRAAVVPFPPPALALAAAAAAVRPDGPV
jgi:hypothetical protein